MSRANKYDSHSQQLEMPEPPPAHATSTKGLCFRLEEELGIVRHFHLSWFAMVMGWGGTALAINGFPGAEGNFKTALHDIATVVWMWDLIYCCSFLLVLIVRIIFYPKIFWKMMLQADFLFVGCVPMGVAIIGMGFSTFGPNVMDYNRAQDAAWGIFWFDVALTTLSMTIPPWLMITKHQYTLESMPATWLLPFVSAVVCSAQAGTIGPNLNSLHEQLYVNVLGYILWGLGMFPAACIIAVFVCRTILYGLPPATAANSVWVVLGPIGQGANAIMLLGRHSGELQCSGYLCEGHQLPEGSQTCLCPVPIPTTPLASFGYIAPGAALLLGYAMWGFGTWVFFLAASTSLSHAAAFDKVTTKASTTVQQMRKKNTAVGSVEEGQKAEAAPTKGIPFHSNWWGVVFPMVTLTMSTYQLFTDTKFPFFEWMGRMFCCTVVCTACYVHVKTFIYIWKPPFWQKFHNA